MLWKKIVLFALVLISLVVGRTLYYAGAFKKSVIIGRQETSLINGMIGAEDITINQNSGFAFVSSDDRRSTVAGMPKKGVIYLSWMLISISFLILFYFKFFIIKRMKIQIAYFLLLI